MKLNEGIYSSPKWLKKIINFEFRTGKDVHDTERDYRKSISNREWDEKFDNFFNKSNKTDKELLYKILLTLLDIGSAKYSDTLYSTLVLKLKTKYRYDNTIYNKIDRVLDILKEEELDNATLESDFKEILNKMTDDFRKNPYSDKLKTIKNLGEYYEFEYFFENKEKVVFNIDTTKGVRSFNIEFKNSRNKTRYLSGKGNDYLNGIIDIVNFINNNKQNRQYSSNKKTYSNDSYEDDVNRDYKKWKSKYPNDKDKDFIDAYYEYTKMKKDHKEDDTFNFNNFYSAWIDDNDGYGYSDKQTYNKEEDIKDYSTNTSNPKLNKYNLLRNTLNGYKRQLNKEKKEKKDTTYTENEISNLQARIDDMKARYKFENYILNFNKFINS